MVDTDQSNTYTIGYKLADHEGTRVIVTLEIPEGALTTMNRTGIVNRDTARYRTNIAFVLRIEDEEGNLYTTALSYQNQKMRVGEFVKEPEFDTNIENSYGDGISFFLDRTVTESVYLYSIQNGVFEKWHDNGQTLSKVLFVNWKKQGREQVWYRNGKKISESYYINGRLLYYSENFPVIHQRWNALLRFFHIR